MDVRLNGYCLQAWDDHTISDDIKASAYHSVPIINLFMHITWRLSTWLFTLCIRSVTGSRSGAQVYRGFAACRHCHRLRWIQHHYRSGPRQEHHLRLCFVTRNKKDEYWRHRPSDEWYTRLRWNVQLWHPTAATVRWRSTTTDDRQHRSVERASRENTGLRHTSTLLDVVENSSTRLGVNHLLSSKLTWTIIVRTIARTTRNSCRALRVEFADITVYFTAC